MNTVGREIPFVSVPPAIERDRRWTRDGAFVTLAVLQGVALAAAPTLALIAIGMWWNANTISHNFIHRPFFRSRSANVLFSAYLTLLLGVPQRLWRDRHLAHHSEVEWRLECSRQLLGETLVVCAFWVVLATVNPSLFAFTYLPGYVIGLMLCAIQGHYEHAGETTSHYGRLYNALCFNDGYHVEHHARPGVHWSRLPEQPTDSARSSRWPPLLRWIDDSHLVNRVNPLNLERLEHLVLHSAVLQRFVLERHRTALAALLSELPVPQRIAIVGGGLFPRTALLLQELVPRATLVVIDASAPNLETARSLLDGRVQLRHERYTVPNPETESFDLVVIPLAFEGDRGAVYRRPPAKAVLVHDWIWRRQAESRIVSLLLLKRLNLVRQ